MTDLEMISRYMILSYIAGIFTVCLIWTLWSALTSKRWLGQERRKTERRKEEKAQ